MQTRSRGVGNVVTFGYPQGAYHRKDVAGCLELEALWTRPGAWVQANRSRRIEGTLTHRRVIVVDSYQVLFSGQLMDGATRAAVRAGLMRRLGVDERKADALFSGRTVVIRSDLSREAAERLQAELGALGAVVRIKDRAPPEDKAHFKVDDRRPDRTLKDITAAHVECARCGHLQLEAEYCARCGVDMVAARKQKRKEDLLIEKKIRELRQQRPR